MRIPTLAEFFTFFAATGQLSDLSMMRKIVMYFYYPYATDRRRLPFHIAGADSEYSLAPACDRSYKVRPGDICNSIAAKNGAPTLVSSYIILHILLIHEINSYQIMCENDQIDGKCSNLGIGEVKICS